MSVSVTVSRADCAVQALNPAFVEQARGCSLVQRRFVPCGAVVFIVAYTVPAAVAFKGVSF